MSVKVFERLLISLPICIGLNSELILVFGLGLVHTRDPDPIYTFFLGEMSALI